MHPRRPTVVYVHGIGNKVRPELLKSQWDQALFGRDMAGASRMAYWAALRYEKPLPDFRPDPLDGGPVAHAESAGAAAETMTEMKESGRAAESGLFADPEEFVALTVSESWRECGAVGLEGRGGEDRAGPDGERAAVEGALVDWLRDMTYLAETLGSAETGGDAEEEDDGALPLELLPLPRPVRTAVFRELARHTFRDVHAYFFGGAGPAIRGVVAKALDGLDGGPLVVVGHSLGSVVAYEVLRERGQEVELLVTVGSPLAITEVQDQLARPPAVPEGVLAWRNASDLRDLVALDHTLRPEFGPPERITDLLVTNDSGNHHGIGPYLSQPPVREPVQRIFDHLA
ncbi:alpha/beta fold hydrolase [Streptomyces sp. YGL11-2]|uniref:alpha/beta fold hydrolase n=1 Tax=Streptomyces sp. YGL11-2 TaxID=3414028 RepID=UPI003CE8DCEB